ncbi:MAG: pitrilysin family protein [Longimonas sp.]|uniref:M16 family metallopeptidase n=1 Tax=Longimonas sp. TaxID=2039626 RepID=UPI003348DAA9
MDRSTLSYADRVHDRPVGPCRLLTLEMPVSGFVSWRGSFRTHPELGAHDDLVQRLMVGMLDKGTATHDRFELAALLEECGAQLSLSSDGLYVDVSGQALTDDLPTVLSAGADMLQRSSFPEDEYPKVQAQALADVQRSMQNTSSHASRALMQRLFSVDHPNYSRPFEDELQGLQQVTREQAQAYHQDHVTPHAFTLVVAGDLSHDAVESAVRDAFGAWSGTAPAPTHATEATACAPGTATVPMADRDNIDVRMGHALTMRRDDDDYLPLYLGNYILGGNFSARLMATVRDELGLTYGIRSGLSGISTEYDGSWTIGVTLSSEALQHGLDATRQVVRDFVEGGVTEEELDAKKTTITGSYKVGLATTKRVAQSLLTNAERGFPVSYLDEFPERIRAVTLNEVNNAIQTHLDPDALHTAMAGSVPEEAEEAAA